MNKFAQVIHKNIRNYIEFFVFYLAVFAIMLNRHYSVDAYNYSVSSTTAYVGNLNLGRIGNYFVFGLFKNINIVTHQSLFVFLLILTLTVTSCMLYVHLEKHMQQISYKIILKMSVAIVFCNVFMVDFFVYIEMFFAWCCGIVFMVLSVLQIKENMTLKNWMRVLFFMVISLSFYQALIGFFVYFALIDVYIIYHGKLGKKSFIDSILVLGCGGCAGAANILLLKVLQKLGIAGTESRTGNVGIDGIKENLKGVCAGSMSLLKDTSGFMPPYLVVTVLILLYALIIALLIFKHEKWHQYVYIVLIMAVSRMVLYVPHLLASAVWMAPRSIISYWTIISMPCMILLVWNEKREMAYLTGILLAVILFVNVVNIQKISGDVIATNRLDEETAYMIQNEIDAYQEESGQIVDTIVYRNDVAPAWKYRSIDFQRFELCERIYNVPWNGCVQAINYYNKKSYNSALMDDETFTKYFSKDNWDELNIKEQLVFDGSTLYFVAY